MKQHVKQNILQKYEAKKFYFASMSYRYIVTKSFNILTQQVGAISIIAMLKDLGFSNQLVMLLFALIFGLSHLYLFKRDFFFGAVTTTAAFLGGFIFPVIILNVQYGVVYTFMLHWLYYLTLAAYLNLTSVTSKSPENH
ncbi:MAG TPA: hypothetical protein VMR41_04380 [Patescibacteria group bacterium]|nr:hypothetical protein [Patescibacteria group bacterium]